MFFFVCIFQLVERIVGHRVVRIVNQSYVGNTKWPVICVDFMTDALFATRLWEISNIVRVRVYWSLAGMVYWEYLIKMIIVDKIMKS